MPNRTRLALLLVLITAGCQRSTDAPTTPAPASPAARSEPMYEGKPLSEWIRLATKGTPTERSKAITAFKEIGRTNPDPVLPILYEVMTHPDEQIRYDFPLLIFLKPQTEAAVPTLIKCLSYIAPSGDPAVPYWAADSLGELGPKAKAALPALRAVLKDEKRAFLHDQAEMAIKKITWQP